MKWQSPWEKKPGKLLPLKQRCTRQMQNCQLSRLQLRVTQMREFCLHCCHPAVQRVYLGISVD